MKKVLFALCLSTPIFAFSQACTKDTCIFDFSKPLELIPAIETEDYNGAFISLHETVFSSPDGCVTMSFDGRDVDGQSGRLVTGWEQEDGTYDHFLFVSRGGGFTFKGLGVDFDQIIFEENSKLGNIKLISPLEQGTVDPVRQCWNSNGAQGVTAISYQSQGQTPEIRAISVIYHVPYNSLKPNLIVPYDNEKLYEFNHYTLNYDSKVKVNEGSEFLLKGPNGNIRLIAEATGTQIILSPSTEESITQIGEYSLTIPEKAIIQNTNANDKFYNKEITYHFSIVPNYAKFELESIEPAEGVVDILNDSIKLVFSDVVSNAISSERIYITDQNGKRVRTARLSKSTENPKVVYVCYEEDNKLPIPSDILGEKIGDYTLTIPEGYVNNYLYDESKEDLGKSEGAQYNPTIVKTYNVGNAVYPSKEMQHSANSLLENKGVGYPSAESEARKTLQNHLSLIEDGIITDEMLKADTAAFYAETDIEYPKDNRYYKLSAISAISDTLYLQYVDNRITLTKDSTLAVHFKAQFHEDSTLTLVTPDGRYLQQFMPEVANTSASYDAKRHNLEIAHFNLEGKSAKECFGLWSINAWIATDEDSQDISAYALVNFTEKDFATSLLNRSLRHFDNTKSNAFFLSETDAPVPDVSYSLSPSSGSKIESLYYITLKFGGEATDIKLIHKDGILLSDGYTNQYSPTTVTSDGQKFTFTFDDVVAGTYNLKIPKGTFSYMYNNRTVIVAEISSSYIVTSDAKFKEDFLVRHMTTYYNLPDLDTRVRDITLNDFSLLIYEDGIFGLNTNKIITITDATGIDTVACGHFIFDESFVDDEGHPATCLKLILDTPIQSGTLPAQTYRYNIPSATFGDSAFAEWLKDPQNKKKSECHVNTLLMPRITVDNDRGNMLFSPQPITSSIRKLSDITITFPYFESVSIQEKKTIDVLERYTDRVISVPVVAVEGTTNQFTFASEEILTADVRNGGYAIIIPQYFFKADNQDFPKEDDVEVYYYAQGDSNAIDNIQGETQPEVFYDLAGRRVKDTSKPGIYVVNGRKVIVK